MMIMMMGRAQGKQLMMEVAENNPGCMNFLFEIMNSEGIEPILLLKQYGITGSRAYQLWNDCCNRNVKEAVEILKMAADGKISEEELKEHIFQPWGKPFDLEEIRTREPKKPKEGFLKARHGMMMHGRTPEGTCEMCGAVHDPKIPHNQQSLVYQYKFYDEHGRWPTWADAMAHCDEEMQQYWRTELEKKGVNVDGSGRD